VSILFVVLPLKRVAINLIFMKKVLVACPTADVKGYCMEKWVNHVSSLTYPHFDVLMVDNSEDRSFYEASKKEYADKIKMIRVAPQQYPEFKFALAASHDRCRKAALEGGYDYLLHLESDVFPPLDVIERLMIHRKKITGGLYYIDMGERSKLMVQILEPSGNAVRESYNLEETDITFVDGTLKEVFSCGIGCVLIHRSVLEQVEFRYEKGIGAHPDSFFFTDTNAKGIKTYVDTSVFCEHDNQVLTRF
jgi:GT2 family glycosyltransferase